MRVLVSVCALLALAGSVSAQTVRLSVSSAGVAGNGPSLNPSVSADGRFVVFESLSSNLAPDDTDTVRDVFLRDRDTDADGVFDEAGAVTTTCLTTSPVLNGGSSHFPTITPDGRFVFFAALDGRVPPPEATLYRLDRQTGTLLVVDGLQEFSEAYRVSASGDVVVIGLRVREIASGRITMVPPPYVLQHDSPGARFTYGPPSLTADGNRLGYGVYVFDPVAQRIVRSEVYVYDRLANTWTLVPEIEPIGVLLGASGTTVVTATPAWIARWVVATGAVTYVFDGTGLIGASPDQRLVVTSDGRLRDVELGLTRTFGFVNQAEFSGDSRWLVVTSSADLPGTTDTNGLTDIFALGLAELFDADHDSLNDGWEQLFGVTDPNADPDGDGETNAQEEDDGTHPNGQVRRFLAEGATGAFFRIAIALANPSPTLAATAVLTFDRGDGTRVRRPIAVPAGRSAVVDVGAVAGLETADVSTTVESDRPLAIQRSMTWGADPVRPYGSHAETATAAPATTWFLAEGSTVLGFDLFYLLQNPQSTTTRATIRFLLPSGSVTQRTYDLAPGSRTTIYVNMIAGLDETDVSGEITADAGIVVERAMYRSPAGQPFALGHASMGVTAAATSWFLAEGATGSFFDLYVLIANPGNTDATVRAFFARQDGRSVLQTVTVRAHSRHSIYVDAIPELESTPVATTLQSLNGVPIVAERAMYWPGGFFDYHEGHSSAGSTTTATEWVVAGGENGGAAAAQTFVLIANLATAAGEATLTILPDRGLTGPPLAPIVVTLPASSRTTVPITAVNGTFGVRVVSSGGSPVPIVVESAVYRSAGGVLWSAGSNALATRVP
jgi:hypothetical protein